MNVFVHELKLRRKSLVGWAAAMIIFMLMCMAKYHTITANGGATIQQMFKTFPRTIQAVFGINGLDLTTVAGYFGVCFLFVVVALAIQAGLTGAGIIVEEEQDKTTEFLYTKPRGRSSIVTAKLLAGLTMVIMVWGATVAGSVVAINKFAIMGDFSHDFWLLMAAAFMIQLVFFCVGVAAATLINRPNFQSNVVAIILFVNYLLYVAAKLSDKMSWLHYASVLSYFDAVDILHSHNLKPHYLIVCVVVCILMLALGYAGYRQRDLRI